MPIPSILCPLCNRQQENEDHLFYSCTVVNEVWVWLLRWCNINFDQQPSIDQFLFTLMDIGKSKKQRKFLEAVVGCSLWFIWKARNNLVFNGKPFSTAIVTEEIQSSLFTWLKYRARCKSLFWSMWCGSPLYFFWSFRILVLQASYLLFY